MERNRETAKGDASASEEVSWTLKGPNFAPAIEEAQEQVETGESDSLEEPLSEGGWSSDDH